MAFGGIVVNMYGVKISFIIDSLFFLFALIILAKTYFDVVHEKHEKHIFHSIKEGIDYIKQNKHLFHYIVLHATVGLTSFDSLVTLLADYKYKYVIAVPLAIGITNALRAFALMIGPFLISSWINKQRLFYIFIFQGLSIILWAVLQNSFYIALAGVFLTGLVTTTIWSYTYAMLQEEVDKKYLGRVLAYNEMVFMLANVTTTFFIGFTAAYFTLDIITIMLGCGFLGVAYYYKKVFLTR